MKSFSAQNHDLFCRHHSTIRERYFQLLNEDRTYLFWNSRPNSSNLVEIKNFFECFKRYLRSHSVLVCWVFPLFSARKRSLKQLIMIITTERTAWKRSFQIVKFSSFKKDTNTEPYNLMATWDCIAICVLLCYCKVRKSFHKCFQMIGQILVCFQHRPV